VRFAVSAFPHARHPWPRRAEPDWAGLVRRLTDVRVRADISDKVALPAWSPAVFAPGKPRAKSTAVALSSLVLDYDDGTPIDAAQATWSDWPHIVHTSWSHAPEHPKFRLVLPLAEPIPAALWSRAWAWAAARAPQIDSACKDASRIYFLPARPSADVPYEVRVHDEPSGLLHLDARDLPDPVPDAFGGAAARPRVRRRSSLVGPRGHSRAVQQALKRDPAVRRRAADALGLTVRGEGPHAVAKGAACPRCGRPSVWWPIEPERMRGAACDHRNSCGWHGWIDQLFAEVPL